MLYQRTGWKSALPGEAYGVFTQIFDAEGESAGYNGWVMQAIGESVYEELPLSIYLEEITEGVAMDLTQRGVAQQADNPPFTFTNNWLCEADSSDFLYDTVWCQAYLPVDEESAPTGTYRW